MTRYKFLAVLVSFFPILIGCGNHYRNQRIESIESLGYVPMIPQKMLKSEPATLALGPLAPIAPKIEQPEGPKVQVEVRFITCSPKLIAKHFGLKPRMTSTTISQKQSDGAIEQLSIRSGLRVLNVPRLTLLSGQPAKVSTVREEAFISDVTYEPYVNGEGGQFKPVTDWISNGISLEIAGHAEGNSFIVSQLVARSIRLMDFRTCSAEVVENGLLKSIYWHEAIFAEGISPIENPCEIRIQPDEVLVLPIKYKMHQTIGNARAYANNGRVQELTSPRTRQLAYMPELGQQLVMLVKANVILPITE